MTRSPIVIAPTGDDQTEASPAPDLDALLATCRTHVMSSAEREAQRRDFAYGNTKIGNAAITREMVDRAADQLNRDVAAHSAEPSGAAPRLPVKQEKVDKY